MDSFPEDDKRWLIHVGYLAQNWAGFETMLDSIIRRLHTHYKGDSIESAPPQAFNRKRRYVRKVFAQHEKLAEFSEPINEILDKATQLAEIRNWALHSGWARANEETAMLNRFKRADASKAEEREVSVDELYDTATECAGLTLSLVLLTQVAFGDVSEDKMKDFVSKLASELGTPLPGNDPAG